MFRATLTGLLLISTLTAQDYRWPIRASQSLSATFAEYRSAHLHAGIDIKTWGEMEVPCLATADGYIERIAVGYNGYGRGLWLRLKDGNVAVYGHLERFTPDLEELVQAEQLANDKYYVRKKFTPTQYPVKAGAVIGYSGTSGTEHPHLHFEIQDSLRQVINPQIYYTGISDTKAPVLDEIMLIPMGKTSRIEGSAFPVIFEVGQEKKRVSVTGPFRVAVNTHDRANGTYNKYNIYRAELLVNDSLRFERQFDQASMQLMDERDKVYPGMRGKRKWRFTSLYNLDMEHPGPFGADGMTGIIEPAGMSDLEVRISDIKGNEVHRNLIFHEQVLANWEVKIKGENYVITRTYPDNGYENFQFYTGQNTYIPIVETLYRLHSTSWELGKKDLSSGVRALGAAGGRIKWIIPPEDQTTPEFEVSWGGLNGEVILRVESSGPYTFPPAYKLKAGEEYFDGELVQTSSNSAETDLIPRGVAAQADSMDLILADKVLSSVQLEPMDQLTSYAQRQYVLEELGVQIQVSNSGSDPLYLSVDTTSASYDGRDIPGVGIRLLQDKDSAFSGTIHFANTPDDPHLAIYSPGKKNSWKRHISPDSTEQFVLDITEGGRFFLISDDEGPEVIPQNPNTTVRRGERLVFKINEDTRILSYPKSGIRGTLDGSLFFPDYNPLRRELSFHIPKRMGPGQHIFEFSISDGSGNITEFSHRFTVRS